ncbi:MAG: type VI secretion system domain-containing protein, partial [Acidobacteriota bacterium]
GLALLRSLLETYWDGVYPRADDDGDLELRATPLSWIGLQLDSALRETPLFQGRLNWYNYRDSRTIPSEDDARGDQTKQQAREEALQEGGVPPEEFEAAFQSTPSQALRQLHDDLNTLMEAVRGLGEFCDQKFADASPDFNPMLKTLEEIYQVVRVLYKRKGGDQPEEETEESVPDAPGGEEAESWTNAESDSATPVARSTKRAKVSSGPEPTSVEDAIARIQNTVRYLRREQPSNPTPYLIARALRWGELRANGTYPDFGLFEAPSTETRVELKRLAREGEWEQARELAETAAAEPCGRAWLDLQRYAVTACRATGQDMPAQAILAGVKALIADYPELPSWTLADDTPTANAETQQWLKDENLLPVDPASSGSNMGSADMGWHEPSHETVRQCQEADGEPVPPDAYDLAMEAARSGRTGEAVEILSRQIEDEHSGRGRFLRKTQLAQVCLALGNAALARPILHDLSEEIARRKLEDWESPDLVSQPLALLYRCLDPEDTHKQELYARICRLDPRRALGLA